VSATQILLFLDPRPFVERLGRDFHPFEKAAIDAELEFLTSFFPIKNPAEFIVASAPAFEKNVQSLSQPHPNL
jgi:hypothetical protein